jgi:hypothetical protein
MNSVRIPTLVKFGFALLLLVSSFLAMPTPMEAQSCSDTAPAYWHYSDPAKTQRCGMCIRWCDGYFECSGSNGSFDPTTCPYTTYAGQVYCPC